jgi:hypothetical protein
MGVAGAGHQLDGMTQSPRQFVPSNDCEQLPEYMNRTSRCQALYVIPGRVVVADTLNDWGRPVSLPTACGSC